MTREQKTEHSRRVSAELMRSIRASLASIEAMHNELAARQAARAAALEGAPNRTPAVD